MAGDEAFAGSNYERHEVKLPALRAGLPGKEIED
jgi:hypothetical protein